MKIHKDNKRRTIVIEDKWSEIEISEAIIHLKSVLSDLKRKSGENEADLKFFDLDWNNFDDVDKLFLKLQGRRQQLKKENGLLSKLSDTQRYQKQWDSIEAILKEDISFLYDDMKLDGERKYYVYAHCNPNEVIDITKKNPYHILAASFGMQYLPFYIGKGTGDRYTKGDRNRNYHKIANKHINNNINKLIIRKDLSELESLELESKLIDIFGLAIHGGYLINIDEGYKKDHRRFSYRNHLINLRRIENIL